MLDRILIVGLGSIGNRHARIARELMPCAQIAVLRHSSCEGTSSDINYCFTSLDEAIGFRPDIAVIANPSSLHMQVSLPLAKEGVHLMIEKPIAANVEEVNDLISTCLGNKLVLMTAYNLRFLPTLKYFHKLLEENIIGQIFSVRAEVGQYLPDWRPDIDYRSTVSANSTLGGGVLLELSHEIDYLRWLFGEVQWVSAVLSTQSNLDTAHLTIGFVNKNQNKPLIATLNLDFIRHDSTRSCLAIGESGTLRWNGISETVDVFEKGESSWRTLYSQRSRSDESYISEWEHFIDCVNKGTTPVISGDDGLMVLKIIQAARDSNTNKKLMYMDNSKW